MLTTQLGATGPLISRIAYGCMNLGGRWDDSAFTASDVTRAETVLRTALDLGITLFDHADIYCRGKSEQVFAQACAGIGLVRERMVIQSKCGIRFRDDPVGAPQRFDFSASHILASVEGILRRLATDRLDVLLLHRPDALVEPEEVAAAFDQLYHSGKVLHFGVSNHHVQQLALLRAHVRQPVVANQLELSLTHTELISAAIDANRDQASSGADGTLDYCRRHHITVQAWAPLAKGRAIGGAGHAKARNLKAIVDASAHRHGVAPEAIAIAWLLRHPARIVPVVGTCNPARLRALAAASAVTLDREEWYTLFQAGRGQDMP